MDISGCGNIIVSKMRMMRKPELISGYMNIYPNYNLENFHQTAKIWSFELDDKGNILPEIQAMRITDYRSDIPRRHKYDRKVLQQYGNANVPLFSVYYDDDGYERRYQYLEARYFYCYFYNILARLTQAWIKLVDLHNKGYNLNIVGYDGYPIQIPKNSSLQEILWNCYNDTTRPFGHELVLYTMLMLENDFPWERYRREHPELYLGFSMFK